jgi:hypothetical protein
LGRGQPRSGGAEEAGPGPAQNSGAPSRQQSGETPLVSMLCKRYGEASQSAQHG